MKKSTANLSYCLIHASMWGMYAVIIYFANNFLVAQGLSGGMCSLVLGITAEDLEDIMNIRQRIEGLAAYYATKNLTPERAKEFKQISDLQDFYYAKQDMDNLRKMDDAFHEAIYELSGRTVIRDTLQPLHHKTQRYRRISMADPQRVESTMHEHKAMYEAIISGNAALAAELTEKHIENAKIHMIAGCK
mgnify:CR=1 FL=1